MKHELPSLPFAKNALEPHMSAETLEYHHGKHHKAYVDKLNALIPGTEFENLSLEQIVQRSSGAIFNNAAQTWNHTFFWNCLSPEKQSPGAELSQAINESFGSLDQFLEKFSEAAVATFGSGWAWLVKTSDGKLAIETTSNADNPLHHGRTAILTCDVWEHAYYIDYRNERPRFVKTIMSNLIHWKFAEQNFKMRRSTAAA
ncbi:MAG: superoxide dismutase [Methylotenera sp.]|nr:superoxide dismutase [Oligoflexia bacterium]